MLLPVAFKGCNMKKMEVASQLKYGILKRLRFCDTECKCKVSNQIFARVTDKKMQNIDMILAWTVQELCFSVLPSESLLIVHCFVIYAVCHSWKQMKVHRKKKSAHILILYFCKWSSWQGLWELQQASLWVCFGVTNKDRAAEHTDNWIENTQFLIECYHIRVTI